MPSSKKVKQKINPYCTFDETTMEFVSEEDVIEVAMAFDSYVEHLSDNFSSNERKYYE